MLLLVPLTSLMIGVLSLAPERGAAELVFSQPVSRRTILLGKLLGLFEALAAAQAVGFGAAGAVVYARAGSEGLSGFLLLVLASLVTTAVFLGIAALLSAGAVGRRERVRITAQLIDALKGNHVWSERYDREMKEFFALQDKIALEILKALDVKLTHGEGGRIHGKGTDNLEAYLKFLQARALAMHFNRENNVQARQLTEEVISLDPNYPIGYHTLAIVNLTDAMLGISKSPRESIMKAIELEQKAISLDDSCASAYASLGMLYVQIREYEKGIAAGERAVEIAPNLADAYAYFAQVLCFSGRPEEAVAVI